MKSKLKITVLILICFTLQGCPGGEFYEYKFIGTKLPYDNSRYTRIEYNKQSDLYINTGYFYEFIGKKENGLTTVIRVNSKSDKDNIIKSVKSAVFGKLNKIDSLPYMVTAHDSLNIIMFNLIFKKRNLRKAFKKIQHDTISIELMNGKRLLFVRYNK